jgi:hypothetical protein
MRRYVAIFDAADSAAYNRENCDQACELFQAQSGGTTFWCEPGRLQASASAQQPKLSSQFRTGASAETQCGPAVAELAKQPGSRRPVDYRCGH